MFYNSTFFRRGSSRTAVLIVGMIIAIVLLISLIIVTNIDNIRSWKPVEKITSVVEEGKNTIQSVLALKTELGEKYPAQKIKINFAYGPSDDGNMLKIEFITPEFLESEAVRPEDTAREIALFAYEHFESQSITDRITVIFSEGGGIISGLLNENRFTFDVAEFVPREPSILETTDQPESTGSAL